MKRRSILVVGGTAAGPSAAAKAKRINPAANVTLFEAGETVSYGLCEAPYAISGAIPDESSLVPYSPQRLREVKGIDVKTSHYVEEINPSRKTIRVKNLRAGEGEEFEYSHLIIATGSRPKTLNLPGEKARNVFHISSREDTLNILKFISSESPKSAVIIGGGYIGMEMCEALVGRGIELTLIHRHRLPMAGLEGRTRETVLAALEAHGVHFVSNARVQSLREDAGKVTSVSTNRGVFECDLVLLSLGVAPNVELARSAKVRLGPTGAIATDERQQTSVDGIYAAGDCCETRNLVSGKAMYLPLATLASRAAWVAGENAAGGRAQFKGAIRAMAVKVFELEAAQVGLSSEEARDSGFSVVTDEISAYTTVASMPGSSKMTIVAILDRKSHRLLGANLFGGAGTVARANSLAAAIQVRMTADEISRLDLLYAPPFSPLWDPVLVAANQWKKKLQ